MHRTTAPQQRTRVRPCAMVQGMQVVFLAGRLDRAVILLRSSAISYVMNVVDD